MPGREHRIFCCPNPIEKKESHCNCSLANTDHLLLPQTLALWWTGPNMWPCYYGAVGRRWKNVVLTKPFDGRNWEVGVGGRTSSFLLHSHKGSSPQVPGIMNPAKGDVASALMVQTCLETDTHTILINLDSSGCIFNMFVFAQVPLGCIQSVVSWVESIVWDMGRCKEVGHLVGRLTWY
jgi:hypothetical protein